MEKPLVAKHCQCRKISFTYQMILNISTFLIFFKKCIPDWKLIILRLSIYRIDFFFDFILQLIQYMSFKKGILTRLSF